MQRIPLKAEERIVLGKKVKNLRKDGFIPAHVFGNKIETEHVSVKAVDFKKVYDQAGETGLIDLTIGEEKIRPVLVRDVQVDPLMGNQLHIDFYQVNLKEKVSVPVPIIVIGEEPELVHAGEAVVIQPLSEVEVEALPTELPESIEVDITKLKEINDAILVSELKVPEGAAILTDPEAVVVKLDSAVTEEMKKLLEEQAAEAAAQAAAQAAEGGEEPVAGTESVEGHGPEESKGQPEAEEGEEKPAEAKSEEDKKEEAS